MSGMCTRRFSPVMNAWTTETMLVNTLNSVTDYLRAVDNEIIIMKISNEIDKIIKWCGCSREKGGMTMRSQTQLALVAY